MDLWTLTNDGTYGVAHDLTGLPPVLLSNQPQHGELLAVHPAQVALALDDNGVLGAHPSADGSFSTGTNGQRPVLTLAQSDSAHSTA